ncbi:MAG: murein transglycosylase [Buchananella hordeovulneris]|nr:murein transglycosylase [Buchananella hordeovulneris]
MSEIKKLWLSVGTVSLAGLAVAVLAVAGVLAGQAGQASEAAQAGALASAAVHGPAQTAQPGQDQLPRNAATAAAPSVVVPSVAAPSAAPSGIPTPSGAPAGTAAPGSTVAPAGSPTQPLATLVDTGWLQRTAQATGVPQRALAAYAGAAIYLEQTSPGCRLGWNTLAAVGLVESEHGALGGAKLDDKGVATPVIRGVALQGQELNGEQLARVEDTDKGRLDGDPDWDRAVGPLQFLPATWARFAADGNADGVKNPDQIDDAALAAGRFLCAAGKDLSVAENWIAALKGYNDSAAYNNKVADAAQQLADKAK